MAGIPFTATGKKDADQNSGDASPPAGAGPGSVAVDAARSEAAAGLEKRRGRGRPSNASRTAGVVDKPGTAQPGPSRIPPEVQAELERLFSPEIWEPMVELPSAALETLTGHDHWRLSEKEIRVSSISVSTAARYMGIQNPKWLAINLALVNLMTIYAPRAIREFAIRRMEKAQKKKPEPAPADAAK